MPSFLEWSQLGSIFSTCHRIIRVICTTMLMNTPTDLDTRMILNTGHLSTAFLGFSMLWRFFYGLVSNFETGL